MTTYKLCKKLIENGLKNGNLDKEDMIFKLDVFLLNNRMSQEEYEELIGMMDDLIHKLINENMEKENIINELNNNEEYLY